jgi:CBS domain-containing protein
MTRSVVSVRRTTALQEVTRLLEKHRIKRVPVVEAKRLVGIVSRADLVRRLATAPMRPTARTASDRALRGEVLNAMQRPQIDLTHANVTVERGVVHVWGGMRSHSAQRVLGVTARAIVGVRKVEDHSSVIPLRVAAGLYGH